MLKPLYKIVAIIFLFFGTTIFGQVNYQSGSGSVASGVVVSTNNFPNNAPIVNGRRIIPNKVIPGKDYIFNPSLNSPAEGSNYQTDPNAGRSVDSLSYQTLLLRNFPGISMTNSIPPDPHMAVGPTHVLGCVNTTFRIWDKDGNIVKTINADSWYQTTLPNPGAFDPQVIYDHYSKRWFMLWDNYNDVTQTAYFLISVSDDSIPLGTWYNWAVPAHLNGDINSGTWGDYPHVGFDDQAIYITSNQFGFTNSDYYPKITILNKSELYANTAGQINYNNLWRITYPNSGVYTNTLQPALTYGTSDGFYLIQAPRNGAGQVNLYKLTDPLTTPVLTGVAVSVTTFAGAPNAGQLGGGMALESGGSSFRHSPIYQNGYIWAAHAIRNPTSSAYSAIAYLKINTNNNVAEEDESFGAVGYWYLYPTLAVDDSGNIAITYSRSGDNEYVGAFYSTRLANDPPGLSGSQPLIEGAGNYVVDYGSGRNRWGDYLGIFRDPSDGSNIWMLTEYASATNTWNTRVGEIRMVPFPGVRTFTNNSSLNFGNIEKNYNSDTLTTIISNYGHDALVISDIPSSQGPFHLVNNLTFPYNIATYDSLTLKFYFAPTDTGAFNETYAVTSNDPNFTGFDLSGRGYEIKPAFGKTLYASSGASNDANILTIDLTTGQGTIVGSSPYDDVDGYQSMAIEPHTNFLYGMSSTASMTTIYRINGEKGDGYKYFDIPVGDMNAFAFDTSGVLYSASKTGLLYKINLDSKSYQFLDSVNVYIRGMAFNTMTNELYATKFVPVIGQKDLIFKIDVNTGDTTTVGLTGFNFSHNDLAFDENGNLYATIGSAGQMNELIQVNTSTGEGTLIGEIGYMDVTGLAYSVNGSPTYTKNEKSNLPKKYSLMQNYPNPFNPSTVIEYSIPYTSQVKIVVYNLLGEVVNVLKNSEESAGNHKIVWNAQNKFGTKVSSGIYFYQIKATSNDGRQFTQTRKMVLLK